MKSLFTHTDYVNYREGLREYLISDRSMSDREKVVIFEEIEQVSMVINGKHTFPSFAVKRITPVTN